MPKPDIISPRPIARTSSIQFPGLSPAASAELELTLNEYMESRRCGTDQIEIGTPLAAHRNPMFAWALTRAVAGDELDDGLVASLPEEARDVVRKVCKVPASATLIVDAFQAALSEEERTQFVELLAAQKGAPNPTHTLTMADAAKEVDGIRWLWRGWVPFRMITEVIAEPGIGKSALCLGGLVRAVVTGAAWPDGRGGPAEPGYALWCDTEHAAAINVERIKGWNLPPERILLPFADSPFGSIKLGEQAHLDRIEFLITQYRISLVVVDSLRSAHDSDENSSRVAGLLEPLAAIAERTSAAIVVIHHSKKLGEDQELRASSSRGSNAIYALARSQIGLDRPDDKSRWLRARVMKENLGAAPEPIGLLIGDKGVEFGSAPQRPHKTTKQDLARTFLQERMKPNKWYEANELIEEAKMDGLSEDALKRARDEIGVTQAANTIKKENNKWYWRLPVGQGRT